MSKIEVLHIVPKFVPGGAERLVLNLIEAIDKKRFNISAISLFPKTDTILEKEIKEKRIDVIYLDKKRGPDLKIILDLIKIIHDLKPHIIHTHLYVLRYVILPALINRVPAVIHTVHNLAEKEVDVFGRWLHFMLFKTKRVIPVSISEIVAQSVKKIYGAGINTPVIYNGVNTKLYIIDRKCHKNNRQKVILLNIGRFTEQKNHPLLINSFSHAIKEVSNLELWLLGEGPMQISIKKLVDKKGLSSNVRFLGVTNNVAKILSEADIFILSSDWEGLPLVVIEAMSAGKAIISTNVGGVSELIKDKVSGILVPPNSEAELSRAIIRLAQDYWLRRNLGCEAIKYAQKYFDIYMTSKLYEDLYIKILKNSA